MEATDSSTGSPYRVPTNPVDARLVMASGRAEKVTLFLPRLSDVHAGPETLDAFLNQHRRFLPVKSQDTGQGFLVNRAEIQRVEVGPEAPMMFRMEESLAACVDFVRFEMCDGSMVEGTLPSLATMEGERLSDALNQEESFVPLEVPHGVFYVNKHHVTAVWF